jgi:putative acetyltransferase
VSVEDDHAGACDVIVRPATDADRADILAVHGVAFPDEDVDGMTDALIADPSAQPMTSLVAVVNGSIVGHVLFTAARLEPGTAAKVSLLAPLGVIPEYQRRGIGGRLIVDGLAALESSGVGIVFVLGHPSYYPRYGFRPAGALGFAAPYPIPDKNADAWMVQGLGIDLPAPYAGTVVCATALDQPDLWRE